MSMYMVPTPEGRCRCLRFTIFNYATKQFSYLGVYEKLEHLQEFDAAILLELAKPSLDMIDFERSPFRYHILCMQSIINTSRLVQKPLKEVRVVKEKAPPKEAEVVYLEEKPKPQMVEIATQMEPADDWVLDGDVVDVQEEVVDEYNDFGAQVIEREERLVL